ncbi:Peptidyl-tRNA hydrolase [Anaerohalosphaera lusitana]|uniref:Peptidyl-tRNA hydrolase n=1 Tax=Anaerohalosphaera lusitana TaxID=1936003 RepID=A0A1U9NHU0_9BACT|nr:aminoacyl-tRNA hydrolase [Anaerohalosphaera lusitana]AQT67327.1 Peptidyl-tRNA hydrolase [Anaerohalosphaera lusitana]
MADIRMIVGLGNPGSKYRGTRHNVGFDVIDMLAQRLAVDVKQKKFGALLGESFYEGKKLILVKPQQFMNRSGQVVATAAGFYKLPLENLIVITDDLALEPGVVRLRPKGSAGGHNGLADIIRKLHSQEFPRLRVGIGQSEVIETVSYVLGKPAPEQKEPLEKAKKDALAATLCWVDEGISNAMNKFNVKQN